MIETRLGVPCLGVVPFFTISASTKRTASPWKIALRRHAAGETWNRDPARALRIGVIALPHMANFTDFDALALEPSIALAFLEESEELATADLLILPGTKQTLDDL